MKEYIQENTTVGISSKGNIQALLMCLSGVLNAPRCLPAQINLRLEGDFPGINSFYLEQIACLAKMRGVRFSFELFRSTGVRDSRDWQIENCRTTWLWMLDDDVIPHADCLNAYYNGMSSLQEKGGLNPTFLAGSKCDVSNRRNYPNFDLKTYSPEHVVEGANHSLVYDYNTCLGKIAKTQVLDTGNVLFCVSVIREAGCKFRQFEDSLNPSGDATTYSLVLAKAGLHGYFCPAAIAYHLEKPNGGFNEFHARGEMLLRMCEVKGFDKNIVKKYFMPAIWKS